MHVQSRAALIADWLEVFINQWGSGEAVADDLAGAYASLADCLGNAGIAYGDNDNSKANNPGVNGLHVGELLDMLRTLYTLASAPEDFLPDKFWSKATTMLEV